MNKIIVIPCLAAIASLSMPSFAQDASPAPSVSGQPSGPVASPTPDVEAALSEARVKARQDPAVQAAAEKLHEAMKVAHAAMLAKDPTLGPLLEKIEAASAPGSRPPSFTADEYLKIHEGMASIRGTPEADAWKQATADYRAALRKAMVAADPSIADILARLPEPGASHGAGAPHSPAPSGSPAASP
jgi:hypothetical protein